MRSTTQTLPPRYRDAERIGVGAMGEIFRATDATLGRTVAIKLLAERFLDDDSARRRFTREARAAARLSGDPNIVTIFDVGEWRERPYLVMEYLGGGSLEQVLASEGAQQPERTLAWLEEAGRALDHAHRRGVVHRDVKPGNLLLDDAGHVHVADFGIASAAGNVSLTVTGTILGTAGYLSPEQAQGERATPASDRYALGIVAYELLCGKRPFERESITAEAAAHVTEPVPPISTRANVPRALDAVFARALAKDPSERYESCGELVAALRRALTEDSRTTRRIAPVAAATLPTRVTPPAAPRPASPRRRAARTTPLWPLAAAALGAAALAGVVRAVVLTGSSPKDKPAAAPRHHATTAAHRTTTHTAATTRAATTTAAPPPTTTAAPPPTTTAATPAASGPHALNDQAWSLIKQGQYAQALPLLQQAVPELQGTGPADPYEGYANYNLALTLTQLGRCDEAQPYLETAKHLEHDRPEVKSLDKTIHDCLHPKPPKGPH